jgi:hypothetical protein
MFSLVYKSVVVAVYSNLRYKVVMTGEQILCTDDGKLINPLFNIKLKKFVTL